MKLTFALVRHASLTVRQFNSQYGSFARTLSERQAVRDLVRRQAAYATVDTSIAGAPPKRYDGIIDLYFDDEDAAAIFLGEPSYLSTTLDSELFDIPKCAMFAADEWPAVIDDSEAETSMTRRSQIRFSSLLVRHPELTDAAFREHLITRHVALFSPIAAVKRNVRKYVVAATIREGFFAGRRQEYDGVTDLWFDSIFSMMRLFLDADYLRVVRPDERRFLDLPACDFIISKQLPAN